MKTTWRSGGVERSTVTPHNGTWTADEWLDEHLKQVVIDQTTYPPDPTGL